MHKTLVINAVGLTRGLLGPDTPRLNALSKQTDVATIGHVSPAVTCSVQSTYLTGFHPDQHGVVGNGWYHRDTSEIRFWHQSDKLVHGNRIWDVAKQIDPSCTCANLFWWFAMYSSADYTVTPRPMYPADGRKVPDVWTNPPDLRHQLQSELGPFPLFKFWGPGAGIESTNWIADAAIRVDQLHDPTLSLVYLPHLDYAFQKFGPGTAEAKLAVRELDKVIGRLVDHFAERDSRIIVLSEYGIAPVRTPVDLNRLLRRRGWLAVRDELGCDVLDPGASVAFAVADHQVAHVYVNDPRRLADIRREIEAAPGVARVFAGDERKEVHLDHWRAGELVVLANSDAWFTYYYWLDASREPDFAHTVDIHRKPGYDPVELFLDPALAWPEMQIAATLLKRKLGFRSLLDVIPTDATLVRGSHGLQPVDSSVAPVLLSSTPHLLETAPGRTTIDPTGVMSTILRHLIA